MTGFSEKPNSIPWPPILLAATILGGLALERFWPSGWSQPDWTWVSLTGVALVVAGLGLDFWAIRTFRQHNTTVSPIAKSDALASNGPFAFSRNPIYLGNAILATGIGLFLGNVWIIALVPLKIIAVTFLAIVREEKHLEAQFGNQWIQYAKKVRRWI